MPDQEPVMPEPIMTGSGSNRMIGPVRSRMAEREPYAGEEIVAGFILPPFQRPSVWSRNQQRQLVESIWLGLPIQSYVVARPSRDDGDVYGWLIDGQQRWRAIDAYQHDAFGVFGYYWSDLPRREQRRFENTAFPCIDLNISDPEVLHDIYVRLAYGGVAHAPDHGPEDLPTPGR